MRSDTLRACGTHLGKKFLWKETYEELSQSDKLEARLWLAWPNARPITPLLRSIGIPKTGGYQTGYLIKEGRIIRISRGYYRYAPNRKLPKEKKVSPIWTQLLLESPTS